MEKLHFVSISHTESHSRELSHKGRNNIDQSVKICICKKRTIAHIFYMLIACDMCPKGKRRMRRRRRRKESGAVPGFLIIIIFKNSAPIKHLT